MSPLRASIQRSRLDVAWLLLVLLVAWGSIEACWHPPAAAEPKDMSFSIGARVPGPVGESITAESE